MVKSKYFLERIMVLLISPNYCANSLPMNFFPYIKKFANTDLAQQFRDTTSTIISSKKAHFRNYLVLTD